MLTAYGLLSSSNVLSLGTIHKERKDAERSLKAEFPPGHIIYPDHRVVELRIEVIDVA